jgi:hypothetical protein
MEKRSNFFKSNFQKFIKSCDYSKSGFFKEENNKFRLYILNNLIEKKGKDNILNYNCPIEMIKKIGNFGKTFNSIGEQHKVISKIEEEKEIDIIEEKRIKISDYVFPTKKIENILSKDDIEKTIKKVLKEVNLLNEVKYSFDIKDMFYKENGNKKIDKCVEKKVSNLIKQMNYISKFQDFNIEELKQNMNLIKKMKEEIEKDLIEEKKERKEMEKNTKNIVNYQKYVENMYDVICVVLDKVKENKCIIKNETIDIKEDFLLMNDLLIVEKLEKTKESLDIKKKILDMEKIGSKKLEIEMNKNINNAEDIILNMYSLFENSLNSYLMTYSQYINKDEQSSQEKIFVLKNIINKLKEKWKKLIQKNQKDLHLNNEKLLLEKEEENFDRKNKRNLF